MSAKPLSIVGQDAGHAPVPTGHVLWQSAFRPFFILGAAAAIILIPLWLLVLGGHIALNPAIDLLAWHGHEMLHGFVLAIVAGFLLTAAMVWTGHETLRGKRLLALALLWVVSRFLMLGGPSALIPAAIANTLFPLGVLAGLAGPIIKARSTRNVPFLFILLALAGAEVALFGEALGYWVGVRTAALWVSLDLIGLMIVIVGGRIIPMFTKNGAGAEVRQANLLDKLAPYSMALLAVCHALPFAEAAVYPVAALAGVLNLARMVGWGSIAAIKKPFVLILHLGYACLALGMLAEAGFGLTGQGVLHAGRHIMAIGGVTMICMGMMTRVSLGHTGRPLDPPAGTALLYGCLLVAAGLRFTASLIADSSQILLWTAGLLFCVAFVGYLVMYAGFLVVPRPDGKPG